MVKETHSVTKDKGVVPVMSSHCAGDVPPAGKRMDVTPSGSAGAQTRWMNRGKVAGAGGAELRPHL